MKKIKTYNMRVSIELGEDKKLSGNDLFNLLDYIKNHGSITSAAQKLDVSYRYAWGLIRDAEKTMGLKLVEKKVGGHSGGGTFLTDEGRKILLKYKKFKNEVDGNLHQFILNTADVSTVEENHKSYNKHVLLASTMEPVETGLLDILEQVFFEDTGILVKHIAVGSGRALQIAKEGRVDMALSHAPKLEEEFMKNGYGKLKAPVMSNNYVIVGPFSDTDAFDDYLSPPEAFKKITQLKAPFISRNDMSGTHLKELEIWQKAGIKPTGEWYIKSSGIMGNLSILQLAMKKNAYTIVDYATFLMAEAKDKLKIICGRDDSGKAYQDLKNIFSLTVVSPSYMPHVYYDEATKFAKWLKGEKAQEIIQNFGTVNYGEPLFSGLD